MTGAGRGAIVALVLCACGEDGPAEHACPDVRLRWSAPASEVPGLPAPRLIVFEGRAWVDPHPLTRGEHEVVELLDDPECGLQELAAPALPVRAPTGLPTDALIGDARARPGLAALVVLGADVDGLAPAADRQAWDAALAALGIRGRALAAPSRALLEGALAQTCTAAGRGAAVLVLAGTGSPLGGGAFVLGAEAISYDRVRALVAGRCGSAGLVVVVLDASWVPEGPWTPGPRTLVWSASDAVRRDAARVAPHGGGALTSALTAILIERAATCARPIDGLPDDPAGRAAYLAWLARDEGVRARVLAERWLRLGVPALAALAARPGGITPGARDAVAAALEGEVPRALLRDGSAMAPPAGCGADAECALLGDLCGRSACARWACVAGRCAEIPAQGAPCDDGVRCTVDDACDSRGLCVGAPRACDDDNPCTDDACEPDGCVAAPRVGAACDDGDPCTVEDACGEDGACAGAARLCHDGDPCTRDSCDPTRPDAPCVFVPATSACDDGNPCTVADQCRDRLCVGTEVACADDNACTADACDPTTGACRFTALADGAPCDDRDPCTALDRCAGGLCSGLERACDDGLACTFDACDEGTCAHLPSPGTCLGSKGCIPVGASPPDDPCVVCAATDRLEPVVDGAPCADDGIACTSDRCDSGVCRHRDDPDACHDPTGRCVARGEPLTDCLVCLGGGVVSAAQANAPCGAPEGCARGACDGQGTCLLPEPWPCCPVQLVACGEPVVLARASLAGAARVASWSCAAEPLPGPERHLSVAAPCAGDLTVAITGSAGALVMLDAAPCPGNTCAAAAASHVVAVAAGEVLDLAVELPSADGVWTLTTTCACEPGSAP